MINEAKKWVGYLEHQSNDLLGIYTANVGKGYCTIFSEIIRQYYRWRNFTGVPWCATFIHAVALESLGTSKAREILGKPHPGTKVLARRLKRKGRLTGRDYSPHPGDLIFFHNGDGMIGHCGIVESVDGIVVTTIEGNATDPTGHFTKAQGGAVSRTTRQLTDQSIIGYGRIHDLLERR